MTVTMTMEEYLSLKEKAERTDAAETKCSLFESRIEQVEKDRTEWMRTYAILEEYSISKHGLNLHDFKEHIKKYEEVFNG